MKKHMQQAKPEFTVDEDGQELAHVALANTQQRATLYADDYHRLMAAGFSRFWEYRQDGRGNMYPSLSAYTSDGYLREVTIARLIANAGHGKRVRAIDGNTLNLRTENLEFVPGAVWFSASDWHPTVAALRAAGIEPARGALIGRRRRKSRQSPKEPAKATGSPAHIPDGQPFTRRPTVDHAALSARVGATASAAI
jgi:hypothetical protein